MLHLRGSHWACTDFDFKSNRSTNVYKYIESKDGLGQDYVCQYCGKVLRNLNTTTMFIKRPETGLRKNKLSGQQNNFIRFYIIEKLAVTVYNEVTRSLKHCSSQLIQQLIPLPVCVPYFLHYNLKHVRDTEEVRQLIAIQLSRERDHVESN